MTDSYGINPRWLDVGLVGYESGKIDRPLMFDSWVVPREIEIDGDRLVWRHLYWDEETGQEKASARPPLPTQGMLDSFLRLANGPDYRILRYARRWGILGLCHHGFPMAHNPPSAPPSSARPRSDDECDGCGPMPCEPGGRFDGGGLDGWFWEPLERWRSYARQICGVVDVIADIREGRVATREHVHAAHSGFARIGWSPENTGASRHVVEAVIDELLSVVRVRPVIRWREGASANLGFAGGGLFGALVMQLMEQATASRGRARCDWCGEFYVPPRTPRADQKRCCGSKACQQLRSREAQARRRAKLHAPETYSQADSQAGG